jgi:hypothetical protein
MISDDYACCICKFNSNDSYCKWGNVKFGTEEVRYTDDYEDYDVYAIKGNNAPWNAWCVERDSDNEGENFGW